ncbi:MAG: tetratricopeptide repeat protein [Treponema sp.]|nr:tetratricopeptide repeat protein [Treponema sp.]
MRKLKQSGPRPFPALFPALLPFLLLLGACSVFPGRLLVMEGNFYQSRGMYSRAVSAYLKALNYPEAVPYAEYGLGSSYQALDEGKAARERFAAAEEALESVSEKIPPEGRRELSYRIRYNTGLLLFEEEDFEGAAAAFREALAIDAGRVEAKRNLELSLLSRPRDKSPASARGEGRENGERLGRERALFDYLSKKEQDRWKSQEWIGDEPSTGPDY